MSGDWRRWAGCLGVDPDWAFDIKPAEQRRFASKVCNRCPVRMECLVDALAFEANRPAAQRNGVLGGYTGLERYRIANGLTRGCVDCQVMIVPGSPTHVRCSGCSERYKRGLRVSALAERVEQVRRAAA